MKRQGPDRCHFWSGTIERGFTRHSGKREDDHRLAVFATRNRGTSFSMNALIWGSGRGVVRVAAVGVFVALAGCTTPDTGSNSQPVNPIFVAMYAPVQGEPFRVPAIPVSRIDPKLFRQTVVTPPRVPNEPGTVVIDPQEKFLYLVQAGGQSLRYGIGVGKQGFSWAGEAEIWDKQHWPKWFPPVEMMERDPYAAQFPDGMDGGPANPLGSRTLYLFQGECNEGNLRTANCRDTLYRIHATNEPMSIGKAVSSGCIRMWNQDVIDLYERVPIGTKVVVLGTPVEVPIDGPAIAGTPVIDGDPRSTTMPATAVGANSGPG